MLLANNIAWLQRIKFLFPYLCWKTPYFTVYLTIARLVTLLNSSLSSLNKNQNKPSPSPQKKVHKKSFIFFTCSFFWGPTRKKSRRWDAFWREYGDCRFSPAADVKPSPSPWCICNPYRPVRCRISILAFPNEQKHLSENLVNKPLRCFLKSAFTEILLLTTFLKVRTLFCLPWKFSSLRSVIPADVSTRICWKSEEKVAVTSQQQLPPVFLMIL